MVGIVSRFAAQKGFDLILQVADRLARQDLIMVVLGSGDREYEELFRRLNKQYPQKFAVKIAYDNALAHKIEAGSDIFLMPSHYEPCGLNQIYSMSYGTIPVVRATGGLDDTVEQFDPQTRRAPDSSSRSTTAKPCWRRCRWPWPCIAPIPTPGTP